MCLPKAKGLYESHEYDDRTIYRIITTDRGYVDKIIPHPDDDAVVIYRITTDHGIMGE